MSPLSYSGTQTGWRPSGQQASSWGRAHCCHLTAARRPGLPEGTASPAVLPGKAPPSLTPAVSLRGRTSHSWYCPGSQVPGGVSPTEEAAGDPCGVCISASLGSEATGAFLVLVPRGQKVILHVTILHPGPAASVAPWCPVHGHPPHRAPLHVSLGSLPAQPSGSWLPAAGRSPKLPTSFLRSREFCQLQPKTPKPLSLIRMVPKFQNNDRDKKWVVTEASKVSCWSGTGPWST